MGIYPIKTAGLALLPLISVFASATHSPQGIFPQSYAGVFTWDEKEEDFALPACADDIPHCVPPCQPEPPKSCCLPLIPDCCCEPLKTDCITATPFLSFIYWKTLEPSSVFMRSGVGITRDNPHIETIVTPEMTGKSYHPEGGYHPGFKAGLKFNMGEENAYDLTTRYTWYQAHLRRHVSDPGGLRNTDTPPKIYASLNFITALHHGHDAVNFANAHETLKYNWLDIETGYTWDLKNFSFRPFLGLSGFWNYGSLDVFYDYFRTNSLPVRNEHNTDAFTTHTHANGFGPALGLDVFSKITRNFGLFGNFTYKLLWAWQDIHGKATVTRGPATNPVPPAPEFVIMRGKKDQQIMSGAVSMLIGPRYDQWFSNNNYHLNMMAALEFVIPGGAQMAFLTAGNTVFFPGVELKGLNISVGLEF